MHHIKSNVRSKIISSAVFGIVALVAMNVSVHFNVEAAKSCPDGWRLATQPGAIEVCVKASNGASAQTPGSNGSFNSGTNVDYTPGSNWGPNTSGGKTDLGGGQSLKNPLGEGNDSLEAFLLNVIAILRIFAVPIIIFMIIYAGFLYVLARGNEEQVTKATRALTYAVIGGLLIIGAEVILRVIQGTVSQLAP